MLNSLAAPELAWPEKRIELRHTTSDISSLSSIRTGMQSVYLSPLSFLTSSNSGSHSPSSSSSTNISGSGSGTAVLSSSATNSVQFGSSTSFISTAIFTSIPSIITVSSAAFTTFVPTTITASTGFLVSQMATGDVGSIFLTGQTVCIGDGLDVSAVGLLSTIILPSVVGLIIWLAFAFLRPRFRQVYSVREWFPPQQLRARPLGDSPWAFFFPHAPLVPSIPSQSELDNEGVDTKLPSDGQLSQRVLWICFLIVLTWSFIGLAGVLPLYLVDTPCVAESTPRASFGGLYSTLQDLSPLRLLQLLEDNNISTSNGVLSRAIVDGTDVTSNVKARLIVLTVFVLVLDMLLALYKLVNEYTKLVRYRQHWLDIHCEGLEMGWLSANNAPGFVGWGEKRIKDFIMKIGFSSSLDQTGGLSTSGNMTGIGSGYRAREIKHRHRGQGDRQVGQQEEQMLEVDIRSLFSIGDTGMLPSLIRERDRILEQLEIAEARYIASFRLTTPEPSVADLMSLHPENSTKMNISRPKALASYAHARRHRGRREASSPSTAPTSYVAPPQYYKLRNLRGISGGRIYSRSGDDSHTDGQSFSDSVRSRIVGSRFQEFSTEHEEALPIGSRVALNQGELSPVSVPTYGPNHGMEPSSSTAAETFRGASKTEDEYPSTFVDSATRYGSADPESGNEDGGPGKARVPLQYPEQHRDSFPLRSRADETQEEGQVPLHLRLQTQGPFVRPRSGIDHDYLGSVYADIREWRTRLKQINVEISEAQTNCYNDIADGLRIKGWLLTGRGLRFLPGVELIEGRSKDDILWDELQRQGRLEKQIAFWSSMVMLATVLGAGLIAVSGLVVATAPNVAHYLPLFQPLLEDDDKLGSGVTTTLVPAILATIFFFLAICIVRYTSRYSGNISATSAQLAAYKATFFILCVMGVMWFTAVGAVIFALDAFAVGSQRPRTVANGSIYMSAFFLALIVNMAIIVPGLLLFQPLRLRNVLSRERQATTPRQRFRALYPKSYDPTYATACCILAVILASTFSLIFPIIGPAVVLLLLLTIIAHRFLVGYVYGRTEPQTGGLLQIWLLRRFATIVSFQPILLGLIVMTRRLFIEGGILVGFGAVTIVAVELYGYRQTKLPGRKILSANTLASLDRFEEHAKDEYHRLLESEGASLANSPQMRSRGSMSSVLEMMSVTLAVTPTPYQNRGAVPLETESLDDLVATDRAARTHPDAPPHLPPLPFADHAEEMAGILYAPELIAPPPTIWLPNDAAGIARSEAYDLSRYHGLRTTIDVRSYGDVADIRRLSSRRRGAF